MPDSEADEDHGGPADSSPANGMARNPLGQRVSRLPAGLHADWPEDKRVYWTMASVMAACD